MAEIDWAAIKAEYITTDTSYRKLAEKYKIAASSICHRAKKENWQAERKRNTNKTLAKTLTKTQNRTSTAQANRLAKLINATEKTLDVALKALDDDKQFNRYIVSDMVAGSTETSEKQFEKIDTKALKEVSSVIKDLTPLLRDLYNIPTPAQAESQRIAAERLELDRKRAEPAKLGEGQEFGVVMLPEIQPLEPPKEEEEAVIVDE